MKPRDLVAVVCGAAATLLVGAAGLFGGCGRGLGAERWSAVAATPDGRIVALAGSRGNVRIIEPESGRSRTIPTGARVCLAPALSPDGKTLAVTCRVGDGWELRLVPTDGGAPRTVTPGKLDLWPAFSEDGKRLVFARATKVGGGLVGMYSSHYQLWELELGTMSLRRLSPTVYLDVQGIALHGDRMAICATRIKDHQKDRLMVFDKDMTNPVWGREIRASQARYTSDGRLLVVYNLPGDKAPNGNFNYDVYEVGAAGTPRRVTELRASIDGFVPVQGGVFVLSGGRLVGVDPKGGVHEIPIPDGS